MTPVIPCSMSNVSLIPLTGFTLNKSNCLTRKSTKHLTSSQRCVLPLSSSVRYFSQYRRECQLRSRVPVLSATGIDVAVEESNSPAGDEDPAGASDIPSNGVQTGETSSQKSDSSPPSAQSKRSRPARKSEMPPVKDEELVPGATFTGKVRSIQPFGAFVDFGAFTDGLVHVSRLSDSFVKDVASFVSVGQEVKVRLIEANAETGRISLTMRESDDSSKPQLQKDDPAGSEKVRPARRNPSKPNKKRDDTKTSKFVKGQDLQGSVKNLTRSGAFISLPDGEEGFLPSSEESDDGLANMLGGSSLQVGQEVSVRVLRIARGQVTLTMKKEEDAQLDPQLSQGVVHVATNPFVLAFRKNKDIAAFLDEREKTVKVDEKTEEPVKEIEGTVNISKPETSTSEVLDQPAGSDQGIVSASTVLDETVVDEPRLLEDVETDISKDDVDLTSAVSSSLESVDGSHQLVEKQAEETIISSTPAESVSVSTESQKDEVSSIGLSGGIQDLSSDAPEEKEVLESPTGDVIAQDVVQIEEPAETEKDEEVSSIGLSAGTQVSSSEAPEEKEVLEDQTSDIVAQDVVQIEEPALESENEPTVLVEDRADQNGNVTGSGLELDGNLVPSGEAVLNEISSSENQVSEIVEEKQVNNGTELQIQTTTAEEETGAASEKDGIGNVEVLNGQMDTPSVQETATKATISPALVKQLREETGAGMMDCKKALAETGGDIVKAQEFLRKKGLASAEKKASRTTAEGRIGSYIHDSRIGVLIEVNCETDFVSRGEIFKELVDDLAMQVAACPQVQYLVPEDVPEELVNKEKEIEMQKEDLLSKPEQIRSKIVEGRIRKRLEELALLEQAYIKNDKLVVKDWVKQTIATIGENIKVKRFIKYNLGEGLEKKSQDFAAEVAAQTAAKPVEKAQPAAVSETAVETAVETPPAVTVSAALVKQLREETGAGMMDCKKALSETGGDLEKAQEYLRKKGLSTADKKSSRLAAEGRIGSYIHDARIGVLIEVNCETDFVGRSEKFKELVDDLAMQVAACPQVQSVSTEDIPEEVIQKEKELEMQREDLLSKPENIREKIVEGRVSKRLGELALLEQPFIKDDSILVKDLIKQTVAALGENIKVRRFARFTLGDDIEA